MAAGGTQRSQHTRQVHLEYLFPRCRVHVFQASLLGQEAASGAHASIRKHAIDWTLGRDGVDVAVHVGAITDINHPVLYLRVSLAQAVYLVVQCLGIAVGQHDFRTRLQHGFCNGQPETARSARHQRSLAGQIKQGRQ